MPSNSPEAPHGAREALKRVIQSADDGYVDALILALKVSTEAGEFDSSAPDVEGRIADALLQPVPPVLNSESLCAKCGHSFAQHTGWKTWCLGSGGGHGAYCGCTSFVATPPANTGGEPPQGAVCTVGNGECFEWCGDAKCRATPHPVTPQVTDAMVERGVAGWIEDVNAFYAAGGLEQEHSRHATVRAILTAALTGDPS